MDGSGILRQSADGPADLPTYAVQPETEAGDASIKTGSLPSQAASAKASEGAGAALSGFVSGFSAATNKVTGARPDPDVAVAFALGWQMQELYRPDQWPTKPPRRDHDLPGLSEFSAPQRAGIGLDQVDVALSRLRNSITQHGLRPPSTAATRAALAGDPGSESFAASCSTYTSSCSRY